MHIANDKLIGPKTNFSIIGKASSLQINIKRDTKDTKKEDNMHHIIAASIPTTCLHIAIDTPLMGNLRVSRLF